jgi:hypothetical protein
LREAAVLASALGAFAVSPGGAALRTAAAAERVALFAFEGFGLPKKHELAPVKVTAAVSRALAAAGYEVVEPPLTLRDMTGAVGCDAVDGPCAVKIGAFLKVQKVVVGKLTYADGRVLMRARTFLSADGLLELDREDSAAADDRELDRVSAGLAAAVASAGTTPPRGPGGAAGLGGTAGGGGHGGLGAASIGALGAGAALLAGGAAAGIGVAVTVGGIRRHPLDSPGDFEAVQREIEGGRALARVGAVLAGLGGAALVAGVVLVWHDRRAGGGAAATSGSRSAGVGSGEAGAGTGALRIGLGVAPGGGPLLTLHLALGGMP